MKNPDTDAFKVIFIIIVVAVAGFFAYRYMHQNSLAGKGQVIVTGTDLPHYNQPSSIVSSDFTLTTTVSGSTCVMTVCSVANMNQCMPLSGKVAKNGSCIFDKVQASPQSQGLLSAINATNASAN